jgi:hypothetical protein
MEGNGGQVRAEGTAIPSTTSDDVDMMDGQDQETVAGSGTHLVGLVTQKWTKSKTNSAPRNLRRNVPPWIPSGCKIIPCVCFPWNQKIRSVVNMSQ